jgi:dTMP kinase
MQTILPNVAEGRVVVCERFADSSFAYQGVARNNRERILALEQWTVENYKPKYTIFLDITEEESERRLALRRNTTALDIFELEAQKFRQAVYKGYQERVAQFPERIVKIDAMGALDVVQANLVTWIDTVFVPNHPLAEEK